MYLFSKAHNLTYPVNIGRNIARESARTYFILPSDIELYPNPGLIQGFLKMVRNPNAPMGNTEDNPRVYVTSIFEIEKVRSRKT